MATKKDILAKIKFLQYVKSKYPVLYANAIGVNNSGLNGLGVTVDEMLAEQNAGFDSTPYATPVSASSASPSDITSADIPWYKTILDSAITLIKQAAPVYLSTQQAKNCVDVNASRAKAGLSPIDCASSGLAPTVSVGVSPELKTMLIIGAIGIGAILLLGKK